MPEMRSLEVWVRLSDKCVLNIFPKLLFMPAELSKTSKVKNKCSTAARIEFILAAAASSIGLLREFPSAENSF